MENLEKDITSSAVDEGAEGAENDLREPSSQR